MTNERDNRVNLLSLRAEVDAEITLAESSGAPMDLEDPDAQEYDIRLHSLRDAVEVAALYEDGTAPTEG
ncbi:MAG TPA: hypothetical protein VIP98_03175 [Microlunatus sp.]